jgi:hypothetical protein
MTMAEIWGPEQLTQSSGERAKESEVDEVDSFAVFDGDQDRLATG